MFNNKINFFKKISLTAVIIISLFLANTLVLHASSDLPNLYIKDSINIEPDRFKVTVCNNGADFLDRYWTFLESNNVIKKNNEVGEMLADQTQISTEEDCQIIVFLFSSFEMTEGNTYTMTVTTDAQNNIIENNEADNQQTFKITVPPSPLKRPTLISPNGDEVWEAGKKYKILWEGKATQINLFGTKEDGSMDTSNSYTIVAYLSDGLYSSNISGIREWTIPQYKITPGQYFIHIASEYGGDTSDNSFTIKNQEDPTFEINIETTPSTIEYNSFFTIKWNSKNAIKCSATGHRIPLKKGGYWTDYSDLPTSGEEILFARLGEDYSNLLNMGIRCFNKDGIEKRTSATVNVKRTTQPSIVISSPHGGEEITKGSEIKVLWNPTGIENLGIGFCEAQNKSQCSEITTKYTDTGEAVILLKAGLGIGIGEWVVHIEDTKNRNIFGKSASFNVVNAENEKDSLKDEMVDMLKNKTDGKLLSVENQKQVETLLKNPEDLQTYIEVLTIFDDNIEKVSTGEDKIEVIYKQPAKIFNFKTLKLKVKLSVDKNGNIEIKYPWYSLFTKTNKIETETNLKEQFYNVKKIKNEISFQEAFGVDEEKRILQIFRIVNLITNTMTGV